MRRKIKEILILAEDPTANEGTIPFEEFWSNQILSIPHLFIEGEERLPENIYDQGVIEPWAGEYQTVFRNGQRSMIEANYKRAIDIGAILQWKVRHKEIKDVKENI